MTNETDSYQQALDWIWDYCEEEGLNFDHEFGKYLGGIDYEWLD